METRTCVEYWDNSVQLEEILKAKDRDFANWTPEMCSGVIRYEVCTEDNMVFSCESPIPASALDSFSVSAKTKVSGQQVDTGAGESSCC